MSWVIVGELLLANWKMLAFHLIRSFTLRLPTPPMETPDPPGDTPGASKQVVLTPHGIPYGVLG